MSNFNTYDYWYTSVYISSDPLATTGDNIKAVGGGIYLGKNYILTSASALLSTTSDARPNMFDITTSSNNTAFSVRMGENSELLFEKTYQVDEITIHPDFRRDYIEFRNTDGDYVSVFTGYTNDIAILGLNKNPSIDLFNPVSILPANSTIISSNRIVSGTQLKSYGIGNELSVYDPYKGIHINTIEDNCISTIPDVPVIITSDYYEEGNTISQLDLIVPQSQLMD